ncbi:hypothetical protein C8R48DRAFT_674190 [Suillus tomentosus]|nr:hypothetical protein C8R48DRAFT_674190 [Suillus tomentosus]
MSNAAAPLPLVDPPNRSPPAHRPPTITPPRQRPLPLPPASQHYLGQLLHEQFVELSDKVVAPALRNAVDAMMPAMIEWIAGEIRGITSTCPHKPRARKHSGAMEEDTEPECEDDLTPSPRRKHPGKRGTMNHLHDTFRKYLRDKRLLNSKNGPLPQSPPSQMVQAFNRDNESPPRLDNIAIDWNDSLRKSPWNTEVINLLVVDFQAKIKTGSYASILFDEDTMNLDDLRILCVDKLRRTHQAHRDHNKIEGFAHSQERENATRELASRSSRRQRLDRLNTRKHGTLERRRKIAEQNNHRNPQTWDTIRRIIDWLDVDGMSGDETDTPLGANPKIVRRVALPWISPAITGLLHAVESYAPATYEENMSIPVGNASLPRLVEAKRTSQNSVAIARLPRNWYDDDWYKVNSSSARALLGVRKDFEVPFLNVYHSANDFSGCLSPILSGYICQTTSGISGGVHFHHSQVLKPYFIVKVNVIFNLFQFAIVGAKYWMSKRPATSEIAPKRVKRIKKTDTISKMAKAFVSTEAEVDKGSEEEIDYFDENDEAFVVSDEACNDNLDRTSGNHLASASSDPLKDVAAWRILKEFLDTDMSFGEMQVRLVAHLGSRYREEDWAEAKNLLFSGETDNNLSWSSRVLAPTFSSTSPLIPSTSSLAHRIIMRFIRDEISSFHAYDLLEVEFSDDPTSSAHWESVLDAIVEAETPKEKQQVFTKLTSTPSAALDQPPQRVGAIEELASIKQDIATSTPDLPTWLVTVPLSKTSFLAAELKKKDFEVYTHSTLPGRLCVKAENTYVIRDAWPSSHVNCFFDVVFLPPEDQSSVEHSMPIPGWYRPIRGPYRFDVGLAYSYSKQADTLRVLFPSRAHAERGIGKDPHVPRLHNHPDTVSTSAGRGKTYIHGLLALDLRRTAVVEIPLPIPESIRLHKESGCNPAFVQRTLHAYAAQHWMEGDLVRVRVGETVGCTAKIDCVDMSTYSASVHMQESVHVENLPLRPLMFSLSDLERKFRVGDNIRVLDNSIVAPQLKGKTGMVVQVDDNTVVVLDQSSESEFTVGFDSLATFIGDIHKQGPANASICNDTPMKGDRVVVTEGIYACEFGEITKVDAMTQTVAFFSFSQQKTITVPIRSTAFTPNPAALQYTHERGYDVVAGDVVQVVRGDRLSASGTVLRVDLGEKTLTFKDTLHTEFTTSIAYVARIGGRGDREPMQHLVGKEVFIIQGAMKSHRGTLQSLSWDTCKVAVQGQTEEFPRTHVVSWKGVLLNGFCLPQNQQQDFNKLVRSSFIRSPHVTPPQTPRHSPESHPDQPAPIIQGSLWDAPIDSLEFDRYRSSPTAPRQDPWVFNEDDREERRLYPPHASSSPADSLAGVIVRNPIITALCCNWHMKFRIVKASSSNWISYLNRLVDTVAPDPFVLDEGLVKDGEIAIRYSSRTKNKGLKVGTICLQDIAPEPPSGPSKKFTLIRGDFIGSVHTTGKTPKDKSKITTLEGKVFDRADACMIGSNLISLETFPALRQEWRAGSSEGHQPAHHYAGYKIIDSVQNSSCHSRINDLPYIVFPTPLVANKFPFLWRLVLVPPTFAANLGCRNDGQLSDLLHVNSWISYSFKKSVRERVHGKGLAYGLNRVLTVLDSLRDDIARPGLQTE